ncbi:hypothetical protein HZY83_07465 [Gemella sp. GH3]|uniref:DNA polymerase domain-containing protein n=1 Tax=unclassified Gemella TaxID=2624949 RepID=UPI0015D0837E|nr:MULTISPECIES: DNA polymerase domain-containing protein [unclassified Gemella]MBF0714512.1 hypothetical protein [Gemella sp. GH3.1]NYS51464.1 hypothetical protein [Gemella sp. GH3]
MIKDKENLLFYDIEVFKEDSLVIFKNIDKQTVAVFHNDFNGLDKVIEGKVLIGYNNYYYDDHILTSMLNCHTPYQIKEKNDDIIVRKVKFNYVDKRIKSLDCFQQIDATKPSLKKIEANSGKSIIESSVDFNIDRKLTEEELAETINYCSYDIDTTIDVFKMREKSYFEPKLGILNRLENVDKNKAIKWNTTSISAKMLIDKPLDLWSDIRLGEYNKYGEYELFNAVPDDIVNFWKNNDRGKYTHTEFGCNIDFAFGGLHGVPVDNKKRYEKVILLDVASMYPNIIMKLNALGNATDEYKNIVSERLSVKHSDKTLSNALKLVINSVYGLLKNEYSVLYNPNAAKSVCIYGQICLYDLCKRLSPTCKIVNINTDGVAFTTDSDDYKNVWKEWEEDYGFTLEEDYFDIFIQRDVNNYIGAKKNEQGDFTSIKTKGEVWRYGSNTCAYFKNNNVRIVDLAIVNYLLKGDDVLDTILDNLNKPEVFQVVLQAGGTFQGTVDNAGKHYNKINRVFATNKEGITLYKLRNDGGLVRFPDTPDNMYIWNDDISKLDGFKKIIDVNFYYQLILRKLKEWE